MEEKMNGNIEQYALSLGFDLVGFTSGKLPQKYIKAHEKWLEEGYEADMEYMKKPRVNEAKSVIVLGKNYYHDQPKLKKDNGRIARYAYGRDYHKVIGKMLKKLETYIAEADLEAKTKSYVDTGPVLERAFAEQANLGFIGKNSCLISPEFGSWIFLAVIFTTLNLVGKRHGDTKIVSQEQSAHAVGGEDVSRKIFNPRAGICNMSCGACTRCIDACPAGAIIAPGVVDARKCISYHTIENRNEIPPEIAAQIYKTKRIFGCDICQEACPHNLARQKPIKALPPKIAGDQIPITQIKTDQEFLETFAGSPLMRTKRKGLNRNFFFAQRPKR